MSSCFRVCLFFFLPSSLVCVRSWLLSCLLSSFLCLLSCFVAFVIDCYLCVFLTSFLALLFACVLPFMLACLLAFFDSFLSACLRAGFLVCLLPCVLCCFMLSFLPSFACLLSFALTCLLVFFAFLLCFVFDYCSFGCGSFVRFLINLFVSCSVYFENLFSCTFRPRFGLYDSGFRCGRCSIFSGKGARNKTKSDGKHVSSISSDVRPVGRDRTHSSRTSGPTFRTEQVPDQRENSLRIRSGSADSPTHTAFKSCCT